MDMVERKIIGPTGLFDRKTLSSRLRELIILRTCVAAKNDYEFYLHTDTISRAMGLTGEQIDNIRSGMPDSRIWNPGDIEVMNLVDSLVKRIEVSDEIYNSLKRHFEDSEIINEKYSTLCFEYHRDENGKTGFSITNENIILTNGTAL